MKNIIVIILVIMTTHAAFGVEDRHIIAVNGVAERSVEPNMALLRVEVVGKGQQAKTAQALQAQYYKRVKDAVEKFKIKKEDFQTENFSIQPDYTYDQKLQTNRLTGYRVVHSILLILRGKIDQTGEVIDALAISGKNDSGSINIQNISWDYDKKSQIEKTALAAAVTSAKEKAEELAKAAGVKIKAVHRMEFITSSVERPSAPVARKMMMDAAAEFATEVSTGQVKVTVNVQMEFEI